jgi:hypothetical protein
VRAKEDRGGIISKTKVPRQLTNLKESSFMKSHAFKKVFTSLALCALSAAQLSAGSSLVSDANQNQNQNQNSGEHQWRKKDRKFTYASFAGEYDISYKSGGGSQVFEGVFILDKCGNVHIPLLTGAIWSNADQTLTPYSYPSPQNGTLEITDPLLGIATLSFPNPIDLSTNLTFQVFARKTEREVFEYSGLFVNAPTNYVVYFVARSVYFSIF